MHDLIIGKHHIIPIIYLVNYCKNTVQCVLKSLIYVSIFGEKLCGAEFVSQVN